jgi:hypothetical protein
MALGFVAALIMASAVRACPGVGLITRIWGKPQDVVIMRSEAGAQPAPVVRPRVLEVLCEGDTISVQNGAAVRLSLDGAPPTMVRGASPYHVGSRHGAASLAGNAYANISARLLPDAKRQPWDISVRGPGPALGFALPDLASGHQLLTAGARSLLVRLDGGVGAYEVAIANGSGAVLARAVGTAADVIVPRLNLTPGVYEIEATDSSGASVDARFAIVTEPPPLPSGYAGLDDVEVRAAATAAALARDRPATWSLEAEQMLATAPTNGLDRESIFELIESYGSK